MDGFGKWVELVEAEAQKHGRVFLLECFEGNERADERYLDGLEVQELSGFLLTPKQAEAHHDMIRTDRMRLHEIPGLDFVFVGWEMDGQELKIHFDLAQMFAPPVRMAL